MARKISMKQALNEALDQEMARDPTVIVMGEDIVGGAGAAGERGARGGVVGGTKGLYAQYGDRLMDKPRSESAYVGAALGAAFGGAVAALVHLGAVALLRPAMGAPQATFFARWYGGMGLRLLAAALGLRVGGTHTGAVPVLAAALGDLGVLLPLLVTETGFLG